MTPIQAIQATLAGEHAAVYVYRVLGGRVSASTTPTLADRIRDAYEVHRARRDQLTAMILAQDEEPVASEVSYRLPHRARTAQQLTDLALTMEQRGAAVYADMVGSTAGAHRQWGIRALGDAAVRGLGFGGVPQVFPGVGYP